MFFVNIPYTKIKTQTIMQQLIVFELKI